MLSHNTYKDIIKYVVPELRHRGRMPQQPSNNNNNNNNDTITLRQRLQASNNNWVSDTHPAAQYRIIRQNYSHSHQNNNNNNTSY